VQVMQVNRITFYFHTRPPESPSGGILALQFRQDPSGLIAYPKIVASGPYLSGVG
jgi:hypothetical protein